MPVRNLYPYLNVPFHMAWKALDVDPGRTQYFILCKYQGKYGQRIGTRDSRGIFNDSINAFSCMQAIVTSFFRVN
jgi:hypothetical protein